MGFFNSSTKVTSNLHQSDVTQTLGGGSPLSTAHISTLLPNVVWYEGASLVIASRGGKCEAVGGGKRGKISGFTYNSRLRLMRTIARIRTDVALPLFITLTYPSFFPSPGEAKKNLQAFFERLKRAFPEAGELWKMEPQERSAPHFHMLAWGVELMDLFCWVPKNWYEIAGHGDENHFKWHMGLLGNGNKHCVQQVESWRGVWNYAAKYLGKVQEVPGWEWPGRFWGVINKDVIPFGEERSVLMGRREVLTIQRYQRTFVGKLRKKGKIKFRNARTTKIFCDASQWAGKLGLKERLYEEKAAE